LVFLDETGVNTHMTRLYGWGLGGKRLVDRVPHGHWQTTTLLCGMRSTGPVAPMLVEGALKGSLFRAWVEQQLTRELHPGDIVILDNLPCHKVDGVEQALRGVGARLLYLPAYSPDLNPIEKLFAKLKAVLRKAEERTKESLWDRIGKLLGQISAQECENYIRHCGYRRFTQR
jgi:transposase